MVPAQVRFRLRTTEDDVFRFGLGLVLFVARGINRRGTDSDTHRTSTTTTVTTVTPGAPIGA